jgi:hypothetical protein
MRSSKLCAVAVSIFYGVMESSTILLRESRLSL